MKSKIALCVVSLDRSLVWKESLEPKSRPFKLEASNDNPDFKKGHDRSESGRDRSTMNAGYLNDLLENLKESEKFILVSSGTGKSNASEVLMEYIKEKSPATAENLIEILRLDVKNLSEDELLHAGRERWKKYLDSGN
jgi:hypothetical protein